MTAAASAREKRGSRAEADAAGRLAIVRLHRRRFRGAGFWLLDARRQSGDLLCSRALKARQFFAGEYAAGRQIELHGVQRRFFGEDRSEEHTSELQSLMRNSYAVLCLKKKNITKDN